MLFIFHVQNAIRLEMASYLKRPADNYSTLYFLASLGAGGLTVTFFMYLMFWVPHTGRPVPIFEGIAAAFANGGAPKQTAIMVAVLALTAVALVALALMVALVLRLNRQHFDKVKGTIAVPAE